jgi:phage head maturation protease
MACDHLSMGLRRWVSSLLRPRVRLAAGPLDQAILAAAAQTAATVGRADALSVPAVLKGRNMLCSIATLPLEQHGPDNAVVPNPLFRQLDPDVPNVVTLAMTVEDLVLDGIAWWKVIERGFDQFPTAVQRVDPAVVSLQPPGTGASPSLLPGGHDPHDASVWIDGVEVDERDVIRFDSPNPAVLTAGARPIRRALLLDRAAAMYADDPRPLDYFSPAEGAEEIDDADAAHIIAKWRSARKTRSSGWLPSSLTYHSVDSPSPADLQLVELQKQAGLDLANALGVDPEDLGVSTTSRTYSNAVDRRRDRINDVLSPYMRAITDRLSMGDVTRRGYLVAFNLNDYMRANPTERANVQRAYLDMGVYSVADIQNQEGIPVVDNGGPTEDVPQEAQAMAAARRALAELSGAPARFTMDLAVHQFAADLTTRTIRGTVLPYGQYARNGGLELRFAPGSLQFSDPSRIKLLRDHDPSAAIGFATKVTDTRAGVVAEFKVARGAAGDEALVLAEDGVLDGFSVGVDFEMETDAVQDPKRKSALLVNRADWRETSLTAMPAFDNARVTSVAASATGGRSQMDPCQTCGQVHAVGVACPSTTPPAAPAAPTAVTLTADQFTALVAATRAPQDAPQGTEPPEGPTRVSATRQTASTRVAEPAPYRLDRKGNLRPGSHEFSADLISGLRDADATAYNRALSWVRAQFDVITTDVNELNPTRQRPDMYVDQRDFRYPIWDSINKGNLTDITPFAFPKFSSAGSLVAAHTEGVEPSSGTFVTTSQTVTPTANSGKAKISRETWDQGGNPQIGNLIWRQMLKGWYEALEAAAVTLLDAASPTQIDFSATPGLANDDLDQALTQAFADLQFVRGGFTMDNMFTQIDLYKALVGATSADGRRLYPAIGPTNATGTVASRFGSLDINGVTALPAWALAATGTVVASSYLFDSGSVHGWASAPQRLTIDMTEVANVYIGIWGYKATAISDTAGVREILYDPA